MIVSQISAAIAIQRYELIRDRIAEILLVEFQNQADLQADTEVSDLLREMNIFPERFHPLDESELFATSIFFYSGDYSNKQQLSVSGDYTFVIDFTGKAASTNRDDGDIRCALKLQRIAGIARTILESPQWLRLGFDSPAFIQRTMVQSLRRTQEEHTRDASNEMLYRMMFNVSSSECAAGEGVAELEISSTVMTIAETSLGLQYIYNANP